MANGAMEDQDQDVSGALEKNRNLGEQVQQKPGQWNVESKKAQTNNMKTLDLQTNKFKTNEYAVKQIKAGHMNVEEDKAVHTCKASKKNFQENKLYKIAHKRKSVLTAMKQSVKSKLCIVPTTNCVTMFIAEKILIFFF